MNITIVEHGTLGLRLARTLSRLHRVHLLRSQEVSPHEPLEDLESAIGDNSAVQAQAPGLVVTDATNIAFAYADHIIVTPPVEYGGQHERYNALICEATLQDALTFNATASIALQTLVPPGFSDRVAREFGVSRLVHAFMAPSNPLHSRHSAGREVVVLGGPRPEAAVHAALLRQGLGDRFRYIRVDRTASETAALLAAQLDLSQPQAIRQVTEHAQRFGLSARVLIECLGLLQPVPGTGTAAAGTTHPAPLGGWSRQAC